MKKTIFFLFLFTSQLHAQNFTDQMEWSTYVETYYNYDFNQPNSNEIPSFLYNFNRHNEVNLNFGFVQASYSDERVRSQLALMTGTYANANLADEPDVLKNIFRANVGVKLVQEKQLWLDAGVFDSHIGFESAIGSNNLTLSRSIMAENSPYYLAGLRFSMLSENEQWNFSVSYLNGWQRIQRLEGNSTPAFGHQISYQPNEKWLFNSSSFIGNDFPDEERRNRYFHNFYSIYKPNVQWQFIFGLDSGIQQAEKGSSSYNNWFSYNLIAHYRFSEKFALAGRIEYFDDQENVIIETDILNEFGFQTSAYSFNFDYQISPVVVWRFEARHFLSDSDIFHRGNNLVNSSFFVTTSLSILLQ